MTILPSPDVIATPHLLADGLVLVSWWKPLILLVPFIGWAWIISRIYDKHAMRFFLPRTVWNLIHMIVGAVAMLVAVVLPVQNEFAIWVALGIVILLFAADLVAYAVVANRDDRVPEDFHIRFDIIKKLAEQRADRKAVKTQGKVELVIKGPDKQPVKPPDAESPEFEVRVAAEQAILRALTVRASEMELAPAGKDGSYGTTYLIDGVRQGGDAIPGPLAVKVIDYWKAAGKLDVNDRRRRLVAEVSFERGTDRHKVKMTTSGTQGGMRLTFLIDPEKQVGRKADDLGLMDNQMAELKAMVDECQGNVLVAAPPDNGLTTTLYSVIKMHDAYTTNVQTVEMEPQDSLEGVRQNRYEAKEGSEYSTLVRSILRRDPKVVGVAETPDDNTVKEVARGDHERTRVYLGMRQDGAMAALQAYCKAVGDLDMASKAVRGVIAERLVRKLCINCRQPYAPAPDMLKKLSLPADKVKQLFKKGGQVLIRNKPEVCPVCNGIGYIGQEGAFEIYRFGLSERTLIKQGNLAGLKAELRKKQLPSIQQAALKKAVDGLTSVEEVLRVTTEGKPKGESGPAAGTGPSGPSSAPKPTKPAAPAPA